MFCLPLASVGLTIACTGIAEAQSDPVLLNPAIPSDYDRGRNVSVTERPRPEYDALGIRSGGILIYPRLDLGLGLSDNVFATATNRQSDGFGIVAPSVRATTDWSRHQVMLNAGGRFRRDFTQSLINSDEWNVSGLGRFDVGSVGSLTAEGSAARVQEEPFSGSAEANIAALSRYRRNFFAGRGMYRVGRTRLTAAIDSTDYTFDPITLTSGTGFSQADRDRRITRYSGQVEYALSPSLIVYGQTTYSVIDYDRTLLNGLPNRDSTGWRAVGGINLDLSGFIRGTIALGYSSRDYRAALYKNVSGLSAQAKLEYFYSEQTNFTLQAGRTIEDSTLAATGAFFDTRVGLRADHEIRYNILSYLGFDYARQDYIGSAQKNNIYRARTGGSYLVSPLIRVSLDGSYARRDQGGVLIPNTIDEFRGGVTLTLQR